MSNQRIGLDYTAAIGIANKMKSNAETFYSNQQRLVQAANALGDSWGGHVSNLMQHELRQMNDDVAAIQQTLVGIADLASQSANALKEVDDALGSGIRQEESAT